MALRLQRTISKGGGVIAATPVSELAAADNQASDPLGQTKQCVVQLGIVDLSTNVLSTCGSGSIVRSDGYIVTAAHVVMPALTKQPECLILVGVWVGDEKPAEWTYTATAQLDKTALAMRTEGGSPLDIAVLKIDATVQTTPRLFEGLGREVKIAPAERQGPFDKSLRFLQYSTSLPTTGQWVCFFGYPSGDFRLKAHRATANISDGGQHIQVDGVHVAASGASGGPLLDKAGQVVGVMSFDRKNGTEMSYLRPLAWLQDEHGLPPKESEPKPTLMVTPSWEEMQVSTKEERRKEWQQAKLELEEAELKYRTEVHGHGFDKAEIDAKLASAEDGAPGLLGKIALLRKRVKEWHEALKLLEQETVTSASSEGMGSMQEATKPLEQPAPSARGDLYEKARSKIELAARLNDGYLNRQRHCEKAIKHLQKLLDDGEDDEITEHAEKLLCYAHYGVGVCLFRERTNSGYSGAKAQFKIALEKKGLLQKTEDTTKKFLAYCIYALGKAELKKNNYLEAKELFESLGDPPRALTKWNEEDKDYAKRVKERLGACKAGLEMMEQEITERTLTVEWAKANNLVNEENWLTGNIGGSVFGAFKSMTGACKYPNLEEAVKELDVRTLGHLIEKHQAQPSEIQELKLVFEEVYETTAFDACFARVRCALMHDDCCDSLSSKRLNKHWATLSMRSTVSSASTIQNLLSFRGTRVLQQKHDHQITDLALGSRAEQKVVAQARDQAVALSSSPGHQATGEQFVHDSTTKGSIVVNFEIVSSPTCSAAQAAANYVSNLTEMAYRKGSTTVACNGFMPQATFQALSKSGALDAFWKPKKWEPGDKVLIFRQGSANARECTVKRLVDTGAQGSVYEITSNLLTGSRALKCGHFGVIKDEICVLLKLNEGCSHRNVLRIESVYSPLDSLQLLCVMELVQGPNGVRNLEDAISERCSRVLYQGSDEEQATRVLSLVVQLALAIEHVHKRGLVHGDIKPANLLLEVDEGHPSQWRLVLTDFGISSAYLDGVIKGCTPMFCMEHVYEAYMTAEKAEEPCTMHCSPMVDLWCFATTVFYVYDGAKQKLPWRIAAKDDKTIGDAFDGCLVAVPDRVQQIIRDILLQAACFPDKPTTATLMVQRLMQTSQASGLIEVTAAKGPGIEDERLSIMQSNLGLALQFRGQHDEAQEHYRQAIKLDPARIQTLRLRVDNMGATEVRSKSWQTLVWSTVQAELGRIVQTAAGGDKRDDSPIGCVVNTDDTDGGNTNVAVDIDIVHPLLWDQMAGVELTDVGFLQQLRDAVLIDENFEQRLTEAIAPESSLGEKEEPGEERLPGLSIKVDKTHFAEMYEQRMLMLDSLTAHQAEKLKQCLSAGASVASLGLLPTEDVNIRGPAGSGKTFVALHLMLRALSIPGDEGKGSVLFVALNTALCYFVARWMLTRLQSKRGGSRAKAWKRALSRLHVLHGSDLQRARFELIGGATIPTLKPVDPGVQSCYSLIVVDEAHHVYERAPADFDSAYVDEGQTVRVLLSDASQRSSTALTQQRMKVVVLNEVVRSSKRIVEGARPFQTNDDEVPTICQHSSNGPPLKTFLFGIADAEKKLQAYARQVWAALRFLREVQFPALDLHNRVALIVPDELFANQLRALLEISATGTSGGFDDKKLTFVSAMQASILIHASESKGRDDEWLVLDTICNFDGLERLIVIAIGLDAPASSQASQLSKRSCSQLYRAITRAQMMTVVVNEVVHGGWLEFLTHLVFDEQRSIEGEMERNVRGKAGEVVQMRKRLSRASESLTSRPSSDASGGAGDGSTGARKSATAAEGAGTGAGAGRRRSAWITGAAAGVRAERRRDRPHQQQLHHEEHGLVREKKQEAKLRTAVWDVSSAADLEQRGVKIRSLKEITRDGFLPITPDLKRQRAPTWKIWPGDWVAVSEEGKLATQIKKASEDEFSLTHTGEGLTEGRHYWEVEIVGEQLDLLFIGICTPDSHPTAMHYLQESTTAWLMAVEDGSLCGNDKNSDDPAGDFDHGDRVGVLLDLEDGSLRFFKNGVEHGPGYPAGSVAGPVALAAHMYHFNRHAVRLLPGAQWPATAAVVPEPAVAWKRWPEDRAEVSEKGKLVTQTANQQYSLTHTGEELAEGRYHWEVEIAGTQISGLCIGVCRPDADPRAEHALDAADTTTWLMDTYNGGLYGNGKWNDDQAGRFNQGDRMGILLDLEDGSLRFFKNGVEHGPGYSAGSVAGPVVLGVHMYRNGSAVRLLPSAQWPATAAASVEPEPEGVTPSGAQSSSESAVTTQISALIDLRDANPSLQQKNGWSNLSQSSDLARVSLDGVTVSRGRVTKLRLDGCGLTALPSTIGNLKALEFLDAQRNSLQALPRTMSQLKALTNLQVGYNKLPSTDVDFIIESFPQLTSLGLESLGLTELPSTISNMKALKTLDLGVNSLTALPSTIGTLKALKYLYVDQNALEELPSTIGNLKALKTLSVHTNALKALLPSTIGNLKALERLNVGNNALSALPSTIGNLKALTELDLARNKIADAEKARVEAALPSCYIHF